MCRWWQRLIIAQFIIGGLLIGVRLVQAADEFSRSLQVSYVVDESGQTQVRYEIHLKNKFSTVYATQYALTINSNEISDALAQDAKGGTLPLKTVAGPNTTTLAVTFPEQEKIVGKDQERVFVISYRSRDIASLYGQVLEVSIPKLADYTSYEQYNVTITVPQRFGTPTIVEPARYTQDLVGDSNLLRFTNVGQATGISLLFGEQQRYDVTLHYHIANSSQNVAMAQVALPPDTAWQTVRYIDMNPQPSKVFLDGDNNWIGEFRVAGQAQAEITARALVTVWAQPRADYSTGSVFAPEPYFRPTAYWDSNNPTIKTMAEKVHGPEDVYRLVVDTLQYNYHRFDQSSAVGTTRRGAVNALADPSDAVCQEFTDVFVALARAAHIAARRVTGYAVVQNSRLRPLSLVSDVLHAWPEYYDTARQLWVPTDPTWADTTGGVDYFHKFDLRHIVFAVQGINDQKPLPAGMYKISGQEQKDVEVKVLTSSEQTASESARLPLAIERGGHWVPRFGFPTKETFIIRNNSGAARYNIPVAVGITGEVDLLSPAKLTIPMLLPWSEYTFTVQLHGHSWWQAQSATIHLFVDNEENQYEVIVRRSFTSKNIFWLAVGGGMALVSIGTGSLLVLGFRRQRAVRRQSQKSA